MFVIANALLCKSSKFEQTSVLLEKPTGYSDKTLDLNYVRYLLLKILNGISAFKYNLTLSLWNKYCPLNWLCTIEILYLNLY